MSDGKYQSVYAQFPFPDYVTYMPYIANPTKEKLSKRM